MKRRTLIKTTFAVLWVGLLACTAPQAKAWSVDNGAASINAASLTDPDEQQPALVGSATISQPTTDAEMDRFASEGQGPQIARQPALRQGFTGWPTSNPLSLSGGR